MPFDDMAPDLETDYSVADGTCGDNLESQDDERPFFLSSDSEDPGQDSDVEVVEGRPHHSLVVLSPCHVSVIQTNNILRPYASDIVALIFSPGQTLRIPHQFLKKTPLATRLARCEPPNELDLGSIRLDAGHVIVNFLVTGRYQCLEPWGTTPTAKHSSEFRTAIRVYMAAESLGLTDLFNVAQEEVKKAGDKLSFPQVVNNVHFLDPFHAHFPWIGEYVQSRMVSFWESTTVEEATKMTSDVWGPSNLHKILIGGLLKMKASSSGATEHESTIRDMQTQERRVEDLASHNQMVEKLKIANERMLKLAAELKSVGVFQEGIKEKSGPSSSPKQQDEPHLQMPEVTFLQTPDLPPKKGVKEVEQEAVSEQYELSSLMSKSLDREETALGFSWADQKRLNLLKQKSLRRAEVLNAKSDWNRIDLQEEKANAAFKDAMTNEEIFFDTWKGGSSNLTKVVLFRALRKKYYSDKLEVMARRKAAVERYQSSTSEPEDPVQGQFSEAVSIEDSSCSSSSTGQMTPDSGCGSSTAEICWEPESHLKVGGDWNICRSCRILVLETVRDMVSQPDLKVSVE
ncbi:hypothetical protein LCI18_014408 [Fusarium solani-melongenae]|uniref:Uncharacterized protein n=1 Tax=Fusarium solani subsp. cucurbitae TaxID=2747967 RepID=A0ACD3ZTC4_FUSSC|nr:hypothetical protein LCI18_014408 [Fusarium solani-melongenae]